MAATTTSPRPNHIPVSYSPKVLMGQKWRARRPDRWYKRYPFSPRASPRTRNGRNFRNLTKRLLEAMKPTLTNDGDLFERENTEWITRHLPAYESLWAEYIGNDGANVLHPARRARPHWKDKHQLFAQAHYTMAVSAWLLWQLTETILSDSKIRATAGMPLETSAKHLAEVEKLFLFMAYLGNIIDQVDKMKELTGLEFGTATADRLKNLEEWRHAVIHGTRIPTQQDHELWVPPLSGRMKNPDEWSGKMAWSAVPEADYEPLSIFCERTRADLFGALKSAHGALKDGLAYFLVIRGFQWVPEGRLL